VVSISLVDRIKGHGKQVFERVRTSKNKAVINMIKNGYIVCFLDVLGFKSKHEKLGIDEIYKRYCELTEVCERVNRNYDKVFKARPESPLHTIENDLYFLYKVHVHYASDSIIIWADRTWEMYKTVEKDEDIHFATPWIKYPKPSDPFIELCNEVICRGIELGLPLRGSISIGDGRFDYSKGHYIGEAVIDCAEIEKLHAHVGVALSSKFLNQPLPKRFYVDFENHIKSDIKPCKREVISDKVLDWPRHWRKTRESAIFDYLKKEDFDSKVHIFENTEQLIQKSENQKDLFETEEEVNAFIVYKDWYSRIDGFPMLPIVR